jgi:hypothetical protein
LSDRPEDVDAAFAAIVADLEREGLGADLDLADAERTEDLTHPIRAERVEEAERVEPATPPTGEPTAPIAAWRGHETEWDWSWGDATDEHYVPPEPPPLPRLRPMTIVALVLVIAGVLLLIAPGLVGLDPRIGTPISLVALASGFGLLFLRIRRTPPDPHDNGAQV